jgi:hypothetical protein
MRRYPWVLGIYQYDDVEGLLAALGEKVIGPAEAKEVMPGASTRSAPTGRTE